MTKEQKAYILKATKQRWKEHGISHAHELEDTLDMLIPVSQSDQQIAIIPVKMKSLTMQNSL